MLLVEFGKRADAIRAKELVFVEHLRKDPAKPLRVDQSHNPPLRHAEVSRARGMHGLAEFGYPAHAFVELSHYPRNALSRTGLDDCCRAQGKESHQRAHLEPRRAAVREPQQVVVETVLLVPHPVRSWLVHGRGDVVEVLGELYDHVLVGGVVEGEFEREFQHVLTEKRHPRRAVRLLQVAAGRKRSAAVEHADVIEAEKASLEYVLAEAVLAVHPPGVVQQELPERRPKEIEVRLAVQGLIGFVQEVVLPKHGPAGFTSLKFHS